MELSLFAKGFIEGVIYGAAQYGGCIIRPEDVEIPEKCVWKKDDDVHDRPRESD